MTEISHIFDSKIEDLNADSVLHDNLLNESDYDPEWLLTNTPLLDTSMELLTDVPFSDVADIKNEIGDVKVEVDDLKDFTGINLREFTDDSGSPEEDFIMPPMDIKHSASSGNEDDDDDDDNKSSSSDDSEPRHRHSGLLTPPDDSSSYPLSNSVSRSVIQTSGAATLSRPAVAVRPVARHGAVSVSSSTSSTVEAAASGGARSSGIRYVVQRQGNPTVYVQANASGRLRPVIPRLKRQETKSSNSSLACSDHYYENSGSSEELNGYMVYSPSPPSSSSPDQDDGMVSAAAAAGIYPGHHAYPYASHVVHRSGSSHSTPMFQSPIPQTGVLILTEEEKRTLIAEGYSIPTRLPLTKQEERNLKKIRRKIKNKISAQESRRKKKEYLETLEKKVEAYSHENSELKRRVETLESNNRSLINQLRQLQHLVGKAGSSSASTCLMVFVLFFAAFLAGPGWLSSDLHQMGYAASLPRLPGPPLMPPPRANHAMPPPSVAPVRANSAAQTPSSGPRGLARFYSEDKLTSRLRQLIMNSPPSVRGQEDSPRLLVEESQQQQQLPAGPASFAGRLWCLLGARCCAREEAAALMPPDMVDDGDPGPVIVVGNRTEDFGVSMVVLASRGRNRGMNATVV